jgi:hypothetical protein
LTLVNAIGKDGYRGDGKDHPCPRAASFRLRSLLHGTSASFHPTKRDRRTAGAEQMVRGSSVCEKAESEFVGEFTLASVCGKLATCETGDSKQPSPGPHGPPSPFDEGRRVGGEGCLAQGVGRG